MAITALATANTTIGPAQYADMAQALAPRFLVDSPTDLQPSFSSGSLYLQPGGALAAGTRLRVSGSTSVAVPSPSYGTQTYAVVIRIDWSKSASTAAQLTVVPGTTINQSSSFNANQINRIPGVVYDALICFVQRYAGGTSAAVIDMRCWGGDGGPIRVTYDGLGNCQYLDMRAGSFISTDQGKYTKRLDDNGSWNDVGTASNPWKMWTPTLRYYEKTVPNGKTGGTVAGLGNGGTATARYRVVDGMLDGYVAIRPGATGATLGTGPLTIDLPVPCASWQEDTWSMGHLYTTGYGSDGNYDWHLEMLVKQGWTRGLLFTNLSELNSRLETYKAQSAFNPGYGSGVPFVKGGFPVGPITIHVNYPVD